MKKAFLCSFLFIAIGIISGYGQTGERNIVINGKIPVRSLTIPTFDKVVFSEDFDQAERGSPPGWEEHHSSTAIPPVMWDFDDTPAYPGYHSPPNSLNYNDGTDFDDGDRNTGTVTSPMIDISGLDNVYVSFYFARETEFYENAGGGDAAENDQYDVLIIEILRASDNMVLQTLNDDFLYPVQTWSPFFFAANSSVLQEDFIKLRFTFDTGDELFNSGFGVFIDDLEVGSTVPFLTNMYASTGQYGWLLSLDQNTGLGIAYMEINDFGPVTDIDADADGVIFGATGGGSSSLVSIDQMNMDVSLVGTHPFGALNGLEFVDDLLYGTFYVPGGNTQLVLVDPMTASITPVGIFDFGLPVPGLAYDRSTNVMYGIVREDPTAQLIIIDLTDASYQVVGPCLLDGVYDIPLRGLDFSPDGILYSGTPFSTPYTASGTLVSIDPGTGTVTEVGPTGYPSISGITFGTNEEIPISDWAIFTALGLIALGVTYRYRRIF